MTRSWSRIGRLVAVGLLLTPWWIGCVNPVANARSNVSQIQAYAGTGTPAFAGDGGAARSAAFNVPTSVIFDASRSLYVADWANHVVRRIDPNGRITTVAGTGGLPGYTGDGGPATGARLNNPNSLVVDAFGNLLISDWGNNVVRRVDAQGIITTLAGTGAASYSGDGGPAVSATLQGPIGLAVDSAGSVFIADSDNYRIRRVDPQGLISTVAGTGVQGYTGDTGPALAAQLKSPSGLVFDQAGNLFVSDYIDGVVRKIDPDGIIITIVGSGLPGSSGDGGKASLAQLSNPNQLAFDALGTLFIADTGNHRIRRVSVLGIISTIAGTGSPGFSGDNGSAAAAQLWSPSGVTTDAAGNLYIADQQNHRIRVVYLNSVGQVGSAGSGGASPSGTGESEGGASQSPQD